MSGPSPNAPLLPSDSLAFRASLLRTFFGAGAHLDSWGTPYVLQHHRLGSQVVSGGPDGKLSNQDDLRGARINTGAR